MFKNPRFILFCLICLNIALLVGIFSFKKPIVKQNNRDSEPKSITLIRKKWFEQISSKGATKAFEQLKTTVAADQLSVQHTNAHVFGELLYQSMGSKGIAVCDSSFGFGCFHGLFSAAISDKGLQVMPELEKAYLEKYGEGGSGCTHGIGHGVLEYLGPYKLVLALDSCDQLSWKKPLFGCKDGVFMEYNFPIMVNQGTATVSRRYFNEDNPYDPCPSLPSKYQPACFYSLGQWWARILDSDYPRIGQLCNKVTDSELKRTCFRGFGNIVAPSNSYNIEKTISACRLMPSIEGEVYCRIGASWSFFARPQYREDSIKVCEGLPSIHQQDCVQKSNLFKDIQEN